MTCVQDMGFPASSTPEWREWRSQCIRSMPHDMMESFTKVNKSGYKTEGGTGKYLFMLCKHDKVINDLIIQYGEMLEANQLVTDRNAKSGAGSVVRGRRDADGKLLRQTWSASSMYDTFINSLFPTDTRSLLTDVITGQLTVAEARKVCVCAHFWVCVCFCTFQTATQSLINCSPMSA